MSGHASSRIERLRYRMRGPLVLSGESDYDALRRVWNGRVDRFPFMIARCLGLTDVIEVILYAQERRVPVTIRSGGHSLSGNCVMDGAVMLDLSLMTHVHVDAMHRRAVAQAGAVWGYFDRRTQAHSLATSGGILSTGGIARHTLGGGTGWLMGKHGLACDNLVSADVIVASGQKLTASKEENPDLFWAMRGGSANFGVVTTLEYRLHPLATVYAGLLLFSGKHAFDVLRHYRDFTAKAPDELTAYVSLMCNPEGSPLTAVALCHCGPEGSSVENDVAPLRSAAPLIADTVGWKAYSNHQSVLDFIEPDGIQYDGHRAFLTELTDEALRTISNYGESVPTLQTSILLEHIHGNARRVPLDTTAFALRSNSFRLNIVTAWREASFMDRCISWTRAFVADMQPSTTTGTHVPNYERLSTLKLKFDPGNLFCFNPNTLSQRRAGGTAT